MLLIDVDGDGVSGLPVLFGSPPESSPPRDEAAAPTARLPPLLPLQGGVEEFEVQKKSMM